MEAIARRAILLLPALALRADERSEIYSLLATMAGDLANGLASSFVKAFAWEQAERLELQREIETLLATAEVSASVELREFGTKGEGAEARVDWYLQMRTRSDVRIVKQKREVLEMFFVRQDKRWRVKSFAPRNFFTYPA
ncbi:MAG: hypothetical protein OHK0021_01210 [Bryobacter sp.]